MAISQKKSSRIGFGSSRTMLLSGTSLASVESLSMPLVQEVVMPADIRCEECQKRVADMISRMNETESVLVNVLEKRVTLICRYPSKQVVATVYRNPLCRISMIKRIFRSSCS